MAEPKKEDIAAALQRTEREAVDDFTERQRRVQWGDPAWAVGQVADSTFRALAFLDVMELARRDDEYRVELLTALKGLGKGKRGGVQASAQARVLESDLVTITRHLIEEDRARLQAERASLAQPIFAKRAADRERVRTENSERLQRLADVEAQLAAIAKMDPVAIVAGKLRKKKGTGSLAAGTLHRRMPKAISVK